jgi:hypothetical protein
MTPSSGIHEPGDTPMTGRYIAALVIEAVLILLLWVLGRIYAP